jgi:hypothetical protein
MQMPTARALSVYMSSILFAALMVTNPLAARADQDADFAAGRWIFVDHKDEYSGAETSFAAANDVKDRGHIVIACNEAKFAELTVAFEWKAPLRHNALLPNTLYFDFDKFAVLSELKGAYKDGKYYTDQGAFLAAGMLKAGKMRVTVFNPAEAVLEFSLEGYQAAYQKLRPKCNLP